MEACIVRVCLQSQAVTMVPAAARHFSQLDIYIDVIKFYIRNRDTVCLEIMGRQAIIIIIYKLIGDSYQLLFD